MDGVSRPMNYPKVVLFKSLSRAKRTGYTLLQRKAPTKCECVSLEGPMGLEPMTPCLKGRCSNQLSYGPERSKYINIYDLVHYTSTEVYCQSA